MKRLGIVALLLGSALAFSQPTFARDHDDYGWRDRGRDRDRDRRHEWREHERREHREHEWREHERREQRWRYRNSYTNPEYNNGFYDQYGVWHRY